MLICNIDYIETFQMKLVKRPLIFKGSRLQHPPKATLLHQILPLEMKDGSTISTPQFSTPQFSTPQFPTHSWLKDILPLMKVFR
jgi:hypothetical protein